MRIVALRFPDGARQNLGYDAQSEGDGVRIYEADHAEAIAGSAGYFTTYIVQTTSGDRIARVPAWMCIAEYGE